MVALSYLKIILFHTVLLGNDSKEIFLSQMGKNQAQLLAK